MHFASSGLLQFNVDLAKASMIHACENHCFARDFLGIKFGVLIGTYACRLMELNDLEISCYSCKTTVTDSHFLAAYHLNIIWNYKGRYIYFLVLGHFPGFERLGEIL